MSVATLAAKPLSRRTLERTGMTPEQELELLVFEQQKDDTFYVDRAATEISLDAPASDGEEKTTVGDLIGLDENGLVYFIRPRVNLGDPSKIPHGTLGGYTNHRCKCLKCKGANTEYRRRKRASS